MKMWKVAVCGLSKLSNAKARTDTPKCQGVHANGCCRAFTFASVLSTGLLLPACPISSNSAPPRTTITAVGLRLVSLCCLKLRYLPFANCHG